MITITRKLEIDAGHRLNGHESKCANAHGHRYVFEIECAAEQLDSLGRIIDFSVIKHELGTWLDDHWDHAFIYETGDPIGNFLLNEKQKCFAVPFKPTAENMAMYFIGIARSKMAVHDIEVMSVKLWETPNCFALVK